MPRVPITVINAPAQGVQLTWTAVSAANDAIVPYPGRVLLIWNASASPTTITIPSNKTIDNLVLPDRTITLPAASIYAFDPGGTPNEGIQSDGTIWVNYSAVTTVSCAYLQL